LQEKEKQVAALAEKQKEKARGFRAKMEELDMQLETKNAELIQTKKNLNEKILNLQDKIMELEMTKKMIENQNNKLKLKITELEQSKN
jgi:CHAD domain-containing protein